MAGRAEIRGPGSCYEGSMRNLTAGALLLLLTAAAPAAELVEKIVARVNDRLFTHSDCGKRGAISDEIVVRLIDRIGAKERHHDRLHDELEHHAERDADDQPAEPALRTDVPNITPRRVRPSDPREHQHCAERRNDQIAGKDDENGEDAKRSESAKGDSERVRCWAWASAQARKVERLPR